MIHESANDVDLTKGLDSLDYLVYLYKSFFLIFDVVFCRNSFSHGIFVFNANNIIIIIIFIMFFKNFVLKSDHFNIFLW